MSKTIAAVWPPCTMEVENITTYIQVREIAEHFKAHPYKYVSRNPQDYYEYDSLKTRFTLVEVFSVNGETYERRENIYGVGSYLVISDNGYRIFTANPGVEDGLFLNLPAIMFLA